MLDIDKREAAQPEAPKAASGGQAGAALGIGVLFVIVGVLFVLFSPGPSTPPPERDRPLAGQPVPNQPRPRSTAAETPTTRPAERPNQPASRPNESVPPTTAPTTSPTTAAAVTDPLPPAAPGPVSLTTLASGVVRRAPEAVSEPVTPAPGSVVFLLIANSTSTAPSPLPVTLGGPHQWELVETMTRGGGPRRISLYRAAVRTSDAAPVRIGFDANQGIISWILIEARGVPNGRNGADAVVQSIGSEAPGNERSAWVTLGPLSSPDATVLAGFFTGADFVEPAPGFELIGMANRLLGVVGNDPAVQTAEWTGRAHWIALAVELAD